MFEFILVVCLLIVVSVGIAHVLKRRFEASLQAQNALRSEPTLDSVDTKPKRNWLVSADGAVDGKCYHIGSMSITIGRAPGNLIQLTQQDASRFHARFLPAVGGGLMLTDMKSNNGTFINGVKVESHVLEDGDCIRIADTCFTYHAEGDFDAIQVLRERKEIGNHITKSTDVASKAGLKGMLANTLKAHKGSYTAAALELGLEEAFLRATVQKHNVLID